MESGFAAIALLFIASGCARSGSDADPPDAPAETGRADSTVADSERPDLGPQDTSLISDRPCPDDAWCWKEEDPYPNVRRVDGGACDAAPIPSDAKGILGNHCCNGLPCQGECVVAKTTPTADPFCSCRGYDAGCAGELECCAYTATNCVEAYRCRSKELP